MLIQSEEKYIPALTELWKTVFGDEDEYIALFFKKAYSEAKPFAHFENGELVSALYLLDSGIEAGKKKYGGFYLYAAATKPAFRSRGIMGKLIEEAKAYADSTGSFIALVPADDGLYSYYSRFGFFEAMHKFKGAVTSKETAAKERMSYDEYFLLTQNADFGRFYKSKTNTDYSLECLAFCNFKFYKLADAAIITDGSKVKEIFTNSREALKKAIDLAGLPQGTTVEAPFDLGFQEVRFGMVYTKNDELKNKLKNHKIYMNLALD